MSMLGPLPEPEILIRKVKAKGHGGHHGGAWKVAYADFVTAMMAFFLLMWLLGSTTEDQRRGIADYFAPTVMELNASAAGANGVLAGRSVQEPDGAAPNPQRAPFQPIPHISAPQESPRRLEQEIRQRLEDQGFGKLAGQLRVTHTPEGTRIDLIDEANHSMFGNGNADLGEQAQVLLDAVATVIDDLPHGIAIRGHTDATPFASRRPDDAANNWALSANRAEATRQALAVAGIDPARFRRLEGVADTEPQYPDAPTDPRNRRMSITLLTR